MVQLAGTRFHRCPTCRSLRTELPLLLVHAHPKTDGVFTRRSSAGEVSVSAAYTRAPKAHSPTAYPFPPGLLFSSCGHLVPADPSGGKYWGGGKGGAFSSFFTRAFVRCEPSGLDERAKIFSPLLFLEAENPFSHPSPTAIRCQHFTSVVCLPTSSVGRRHAYVPHHTRPLPPRDLSTLDPVPLP